MTEPLDLEKFVKVMALTTSDQDGEALAATRMGNAILRRSGLTWEQVLCAPTARVKRAPIHQGTDRRAWAKSFFDEEQERRREEAAREEQRRDRKKTQAIQKMLKLILGHYADQGNSFSIWHLHHSHFAITGYFSASTEASIVAEFKRIFDPEGRYE